MGPKPLHRHQLKGGRAPHLYQGIYRAGGPAENHIKAWKNHLAADRTSCPKAGASQFRLFLHAGAYWLMWSLRRAMPGRSSCAPDAVRHPACCGPALNVAASSSRKPRSISIAVERPGSGDLRHAPGPPAAPGHLKRGQGSSANATPFGTPASSRFDNTQVADRGTRPARPGSATSTKPNYLLYTQSQGIFWVHRSG